MKNDFIGKNKAGETVKISVPPTLLMTAIAQVPDAGKTVPGYFRSAGDQIYLLGELTSSLLASVFSEEFEAEQRKPEYPNLQKNRDLYMKIHKAIQQGLLSSCHDISEGGVLSAIAEACFGNETGVELNLNPLKWENLWSEMGSQFVVSIDPAHEEKFKEIFPQALHLGTVTATDALTWIFDGEASQESLQTLKDLWSKGVLNVYQS